MMGNDFYYHNCVYETEDKGRNSGWVMKFRSIWSTLSFHLVISINQSIKSQLWNTITQSKAFPSYGLPLLPHKLESKHIPFFSSLVGKTKVFWAIFVEKGKERRRRKNQHNGTHKLFLGDKGEVWKIEGNIRRKKLRQILNGFYLHPKFSPSVFFFFFNKIS